MAFLSRPICRRLEKKTDDGLPRQVATTASALFRLVLLFGIGAASCSSGAAQSPAEQRDASDEVVGEPCPGFSGNDAGQVAATAANVSLLLALGCVSCHTGNANALVFDLHQSPAVLVGVPSHSESCGGTLVVPGDAARSYLFAKISELHPCSGEQMPAGEFGTGSALPACEQDLLRRWILAGAVAQP